MKAPFHLAFPVKSITVTKMFYHEVLGCPIGRMTDSWIDFDFFGNQLSGHLCTEMEPDQITSEVDNERVPLRHFGVILENQLWQEIAVKLKASGIEFIIEPKIRYKGMVGEQHVLFVYDPSGNALEFKSFTNPEEIFK